MARRFIFRIENPDTGEGIYRLSAISPPFYRESADTKEMWIRPCPNVDVALSITAEKHCRALDRMNENARLLFGFQSPELLDRWFCLSEREEIGRQSIAKRIPVRIRMLAIDSRFIGDLKTQCTFDTLGHPDTLVFLPVTASVADMRELTNLWK